MSKDLPTADRPKAPAPKETAADGEGTASVSPASGDDRNGVLSGILSKAESKTKNQRRVELILKDNRQGLTAQEGVELQRLEKEVAAYLDAHFPGPKEFLDRIEECARKMGYKP